VADVHFPLHEIRRAEAIAGFREQSIHKGTGKVVLRLGTLAINISPIVASFQIDLKSRTINLIGFSGSVQHTWTTQGPAADAAGGAAESGRQSARHCRPNRSPRFYSPNGIAPPGERASAAHPPDRGTEIQIAPAQLRPLPKE